MASIARTQEREFEGLTDAELYFLREKGYEILKKLGEGNTREAYLARYSSGDVKRLRVIKVPKMSVDDSNIALLIHLDKRDLNQREIETSNLLSHPNIVAVVDNFMLGDRNVTVEDHFEAQDLESIVQTTGPISGDEKLHNIFKQIIEAQRYLIHEQGVLHRDVKPSNILLNRKGLVKLSDLQNSAQFRDIVPLVLPTRGGSPYTHPDLLQAPVTNKPACASEHTEIYSLGATLYFLLTGKNVFGYKLETDLSGREIDVVGKKFKVVLKDNGKKIDCVSQKEHESQLRTALKEVPRRYRNIVYKALSLDENKSYHHLCELEKDFKRSNKSVLEKIGESALSVVKPAVISAGIVGALSAGITWSIMHPHESKPTLVDILRTEDYRNFSLDALSGIERNYALDILVPYMCGAKKRLPAVLAGQHSYRSTNADYIQNMARFGNDVHRLNLRLVSAWLKACYLADKDQVEKEFKGERIAPSFVPKKFLLVNQSVAHIPAEAMDDNQKIAHGIMYLKQCLGKRADVADVFAEYFSTNEEIHTARVRTGSIKYFPRVADVKNGCGTLEKGYRAFLPAQKLIDTAVALYMLTDEEGKTDFSRIPKLDFIEGEYTSRLRLQ